MFGDGQTYRGKVELMLVGSNRADITNSRKHMFANHDVSRPVSKTCFTSGQHVHIYVTVYVVQWVSSAGSRVSDNMSIELYI